MKESNTRITGIISTIRKWYPFHAGTQGVSDRVTKEHKSRFRVTLEYQRIIYFSFIICLKVCKSLNGTWCRWIWTSMTILPQGYTGCTFYGGTPENMSNAPSTLPRSAIFRHIQNKNKQYGILVNMLPIKQSKVYKIL